MGTSLLGTLEGTTLTSPTRTSTTTTSTTTSPTKTIGGFDIFTETISTSPSKFDTSINVFQDIELTPTKGTPTNPPLIFDDAGTTPTPSDGTSPTPGDGTTPTPGDGTTPTPGDDDTSPGPNPDGRKNLKPLLYAAGIGLGIFLIYKLSKN